MLRSFSDEALLALVARADPEALGVLYDRYASAIYGLARRMGFDPTTQEDCVQEVFVRIWNKAGSFDPKRASGRGWLLAVAHHYCVDKVRNQASRPQALSVYPDDDNHPEAFDLPGPGLDEEAALNRVRLARAMGFLKPEERQVLEALYYQGYTYPGAAQVLGMPLGTFKSRVQKALQKLREVLREA